MKRRIATRKRDIHREEQRRAKGAKPYLVLETDIVTEGGRIVPEGSEAWHEIKAAEKPKKAPAKKKPAGKKKAPAKKKAKKDA